MMMNRPIRTTIRLAAWVCVLVPMLVVGGSLDREAAIKQGLSRHLELKVAALEIERAKVRLRWAGRLSNPEVELSSMSDLIGENDREGNFQIAFSQRFPVTSRLQDEKVVRVRDVELAEIEFRVRQRQLAYEIDKAWIETNAAVSSSEAAARRLQLNKEIGEFIAGRAEVGEASSLDVVQATLNGKLLEQEVGMAKAAAAELGSRLKQLMGLEQSAEIQLSEAGGVPESAPAASIKMETVLENRPDYLLLLASGELGEAQLNLAMAQRWEDIAVKVFMERERAVDEPNGLEKNTFTGVGVSIPLPLRNQNEAAIEEAELDIEKARLARAAKLAAIHGELRRTLESRLAAYELAVAARGEALPLARKNLDEFKAAQKNGQASLLQVQQAQSQLLQLENAALELQKRYELLDAEVRFIAGDYPIPETNSK